MPVEKQAGTGVHAAGAGKRISRVQRRRRAAPALKAETKGRRAREADGAKSFATTTEPPRIQAGSKKFVLVQLLSRPAGVRITDLVKALGWQPHSVRAAMTALRRSGYAIDRSRNATGETVYHARQGADASASARPRSRRAA